MTLLGNAEVSRVQLLGPFDFRWPADVESFEAGWEFTLTASEDQVNRVRHGLGGREVYGRYRVHTVTWLDGEVQVEGVEADDYPSTQALLSVLRNPDKTLVRTNTDVQTDYEGFDIVNHRREIDAKWSRDTLAVKIREDDLVAWGVHAFLRRRSRASTAERRVREAGRPTLPTLPPAPTLERRAVAEALLFTAGCRRAIMEEQFALRRTTRQTPLSTPTLSRSSSRSSATRASSRSALGTSRMSCPSSWATSARRKCSDEDGVRAAVSQPPKLHRFVNDVAQWVHAAACIVLDRCNGDTSRIWSD